MHFFTTSKDFLEKLLDNSKTRFVIIFLIVANEIDVAPVAGGRARQDKSCFLQRIGGANGPNELSREQYEQFRTYFFQKRDVSQCVEPLFAKVLAHDRFFSVFISNKPAITPLQNQAGSRLQLGNRVPYDVITPCDKNCQHHALGHLYVGDMLCHQSVDHLDHIRQIFRT